MARDFAKELRDAREAKDWDRHERIWEDRRHKEVDYDEDSFDDLEDEDDAQAIWLANSEHQIFNRRGDHE